jgi:hypothetical protein
MKEDEWAWERKEMHLNPCSEKLEERRHLGDIDVGRKAVV